VLCITDPNSELAGIVHAYSKGAVSFSWGHAECLQAFQQLQNSKDNNDNSASHLLKQFTVDGLVERIKAESNLE